jgi:hypothetical protein
MQYAVAISAGVVVMLVVVARLLHQNILTKLDEKTATAPPGPIKEVASTLRTVLDDSVVRRGLTAIHTKASSTSKRAGAVVLGSSMTESLTHAASSFGHDAQRVYHATMNDALRYGILH